MQEKKYIISRRYDEGVRYYSEDLGCFTPDRIYATRFYQASTCKAIIISEGFTRACVELHAHQPVKLLKLSSL